ncbi:hypothetical protein [Reinekea sp. G2M2-21]|uniref:hypothetical protein n=1 Tax=Reinekea sp. G2M2-21 TaxID=2788942 RepID=UPI0018AB1F2B|nr:hypothetical protein [Reinekea sp. G2M2-21]
MSKSNINQIAIFSGIAHLLSDLCPGLELEPRQMNALLKISTDIADIVNAPAIRSTEDIGLVNWLASDDTGSSSLYLASVLFPSAFKVKLPCFAYPYDPSDFSRCIKLLRAEPSLRTNYWDKILNDNSPIWRELAQRWDELESGLLAEAPNFLEGQGSAPKTYAAIKEIIAKYSPQ